MISIATTLARCGITPSPAQLCFCKSGLGELLDLAELEIFIECTGRLDPPSAPTEVDGLGGRKTGKTSIMGAGIVVHRAAIDEDEPGVYAIISPSKSDQATIAWSAALRMLQRGFPGLIANVVESAGKILLHNGNEIRISCGDYRTLRGPKYKVVVCDEACFFHSDDPEEGGANPLEYILDAVSGGMIATANPLLLLLSTPWIKSGVMFEHWRDREANPDRLVWRAPTLTMNPFANRELMERHRRDRGENFYRREYLAEFSEDSFAFIESADVDNAIAVGMPCFPPHPETFYCMGLDPGRKRDHFGAAIAHKEGADAVVVDWAKEWKPGLFGLQYRDILPEIFQKAREYSIRRIASDQVDYGGLEASLPTVGGIPEFEMERIMTGGQHGAELADVTRALFAQRKLILPDQSGLAAEFKRLADYMTQGGVRDIRARRGADDRTRACMLAIFQAFHEPPAHEPWITVLALDGSDELARAAQRAEADLRSREREDYFFRRRGGLGGF